MIWKQHLNKSLSWESDSEIDYQIREQDKESRNEEQRYPSRERHPPTRLQVEMKGPTHSETQSHCNEQIFSVESSHDEVSDANNNNSDIPSGEEDEIVMLGPRNSTML